MLILIQPAPVMNEDIRWSLYCSQEDSREEVSLSASILSYFADNAATFLAPRPLEQFTAGSAWINAPAFRTRAIADPSATNGKASSGIVIC